MYHGCLILAKLRRITVVSSKGSILPQKCRVTSKSEEVKKHMGGGKCKPEVVCWNNRKAQGRPRQGVTMAWRDDGPGNFCSVKAKKRFARVLS